jgi:DNA (cytosine-5)-methyltransferase 1
MISDQDQQRAEKRFKQKERARDGRKAMTEYETQARATRAKTERLKGSFPRDYRFMGTFDSQFRQIGNAVPPAFAAFLASHLFIPLIFLPF